MATVNTLIDTGEFVHPASGNKIQGRRMFAGEIVRPNDRYADFCGGWLKARREDVGASIKLGCATLWVRPHISDKAQF